LIEFNFDQLPALLPRYLRAAFAGLPGRRPGADIVIPQIRATADAVIAEPDRVQRCRQLLNHPDDGLLPPTFPQMLAAPLHLSVLTAREFPLRAGGIVHLANTIQVLEPIAQDQELQLVVTLKDQEDTARGIELTMHTAAVVAGRVVWKAESLMLSRQPTSVKRRRRAPRPSPGSLREVDTWRAKRNVGRRYATLSGDYNPIHLSAATARAFGFRAAIAHGMWSFGRSIAGLSRFLQPPYGVEAEFRRPLLLPARVRLLLDTVDARHFELVDATSGKAYLAGFLNLDTP